MPHLRILLGEQEICTEAAPLTFGRAGDVVLGSSPYLGRVVGRFHCQGESWAIENCTESVTLRLRTANRRRVRIPPGSSEMLTAADGQIKFKTAKVEYRLGWAVD